MDGQMDEHVCVNFSSRATVFSISISPRSHKYIFIVMLKFSEMKHFILKEEKMEACVQVSHVTTLTGKLTSDH